MNGMTKPIEQLIEESRKLVNTHPDLAREKAEEALRLSREVNSQEGLFESSFLLGRIHTLYNACQEASVCFDECSAIAERLRDYKRKVQAINANGVIYDNMLIHSKSLDCFLEALDLCKTYHFDELEPSILNNISSVFSDLRDHQTALNYLLQAREKAAALNEPVGMYYRNIANVYLELKDYDKCRSYCLMARNAIWREKDYEAHGDIYFIMAALFNALGKLKKAFRYYHLGFKLSERNHCFYSHTEALIDLARIFFCQRAYDSARKYLDKALEMCHQYDFNNLLKTAYRLLADISKAMGDIENEIETLRQYTVVSTMLEEREIAKKRVYAQMQLSMFHIKKEHATLKDQVRKDDMTGCLSYRDFEATVRKELNSGKGQAAIYFMDVDNLKYINDKYGHSAGDQLIREFATTLKDVLKGKGLAFRKGGDEFIVFLPFQHDEELHTFNKELFARLSKARIIGKTLTPISCSVGISIAPKHSTNPRELENMADKAMYEAKKLGKRCCCFYDGSGLE
jgi:diguanylate cyclase (GGDEF)-like protein